ncbi:class I SAM-dependent methyltransferase [Moorena sp. SIO4G3]|uniref:class I SAM-dependent DNA methyltransferase n=1 Tax=Moorena sp. SIO4G3 TaxID=2607821 RepID=UPI00142C3E89|nr:class I SAM-dependent methyltransferase [Moorena sp. SIO4G3]NEO79455.1 class I SAM-dependent methyltransferase [Moorena sp. SIO4G3]
MSITDRVSQVYSSKNNQELIANYDRWAEEYDQDFTGYGDYVSLQKIADIALNCIPKSAKILDAAAGTGLVGQRLYQEGYRHLVAIDMSQEMLNKARQKNVYSELYQQVLGEPLDFSSNSFDANINVGVFTYNHAPSHAFDELIRITKPEGYIIFTMRPDFYESSQDFQGKMASLESSGQWQLIERGDKYYSHPNTKQKTPVEIWTYQVK